MATPGAATSRQQPAGRAGGAPLLGDQEANNVAADGRDADTNNAAGAAAGRGGFCWLTLLGLVFLTFNSATAVLRSRGDPAAVAFVCFSYADLLALFACLRAFERAPAGSPRRERLKAAVWALTTLLTLAFSWKVAAVMPAPAALVVWLMAFATIAGGFVAFFVYKEKGDDAAV